MFFVPNVVNKLKASDKARVPFYAVVCFCLKDVMKGISMSRKKRTQDRVDGLGPKDKLNIRKALRQVWAYSYPRKLCIARATREDGFAVCEQCKHVVAKVYADHIEPCGAVDSGIIERMWCSSKNLQALCKKCHDRKTRQERLTVKRLIDSDLDF